MSFMRVPWLRPAAEKPSKVKTNNTKTENMSTYSGIYSIYLPLAPLISNGSAIEGSAGSSRYFRFCQ